MTLYSYNIRITDSEMIMLRKALKNMVIQYEEQLEKGETSILGS